MLKGAIVGFGDVALNGHWPAWAASEDATIVAVVDRTSQRRDLASQLANGLPAYSSIEELADANLAVDFVDICTPPASHAEPVRVAIDRGWHVLCEKPVLLHSSDFESLGRLARDRGVAVMPVHNWKHAPIVKRATDLLRSGAIGRLRSVAIDTERPQPCADAGGRSWRRDPAIAGGGILMDHGWHAAYLALHWFGETPTRVKATVQRPATDEVEDEAALVVSFPSGDASIALTWRGTVRRNLMRLIGDRGELMIADAVLHLDVEGARTTTRFDEALSAGSHHAGWLRVMLPDVIAAFRDPARSRAPFAEAAACLSIVEQAYRSAGAAVSVPA